MKMYELLAKPEAWCQRTVSRDKDGTPNAINPVSWCIIGASDRCYDIHDAILARQRIRSEIMKSWAVHGCNTIGSWNDAPERTHDEVLSLLRKLDV